MKKLFFGILVTSSVLVAAQGAMAHSVGVSHAPSPAVYATHTA